MESEPTLDADLDQLAGQSEVETAASDATGLIDDELLVEEISIDGMCGVY